jgi:predicted transcriptional regulator
MSEPLGSPDQPGAVLGTLLSSTAMADVLLLFRRNPGLIDTVDGIARRVGSKSSAVSSEVSKLENLEILKKKTVGKAQVYFLDREKDAETQKQVAEYIMSVGGSKSH